MKSRKFVPGALHHIYFITADGGVLFYRITDRVAFFTILSILAQRYHVTVVAVSIMFTHVHLVILTADLAQMRLFVGQLLKTFSRIVKEDRSCPGPVFKRPFGSAPKVSAKEQRSCLIYVYNNPVEKHLCGRASEDRWTFLAYCRDAYPFSERLNKHDATRHLREACCVVDAESKAGRFLRPAIIRRLYRPLDRKEQEQLTDYIIGRYQFLSYDIAISLFGDYDTMLAAAKASSGKEFDVGEEFDPSSDVPYSEMCALAGRSGLLDQWKLLHLSPAEQQLWMRRFRNATSASDIQIRKFLHCWEEVSATRK